MKKLNHLILGLLTTSLLLVSCKKESTPSPQDRIEVVIDGQKWTGEMMSWASSGGIEQVNAGNTDGSNIQIFMDEGATGTHDVTQGNVTVSFNDAITTFSNNVSGTVTINTNSDQLIEGTFNVVNASHFTTDTIVMTNGVFRISFN
jgi:hypothetical protein